ncbi:uncharacterized protein MELLADRAFT_112530 [Melampsora larici-populina 98AG31]|uniref:Tet-like 2OG-Fe(II) oxygenase domain-containing protein n=1 Tax=Melampsora larici-populina (strain 98AG31 / pathotype 3-4-7) TaxID=747676 RepID=F4S6S5_MELLP|nr:uncharacterized protein MELLADRAFT_112530 [Melampsora larici-populina 98AG31]EGF99666.1 hypothetical protein MELLADRAFT_112530 [Melampsora larici-populina 98AG31]
MANHSSTFTCYKGLCIITDQNNGAVIAIIKFTPFDTMSRDELSELEAVSKYLVEEKYFCNPVTLNAAMKGGYMGVIGWRAAFMSLEYYGLYAPRKFIQDNKDLLDQWVKRLPFRARLEAFYAQQYSYLSEYFFKQAQDQMKDLKIPSFGQLHSTDAEEGTRHGHAGNLSFTMNKFNNTAHADHDSSTATFLLSIPVSKDGRLATKAQGFDVIDGRVIIDYGACDGPVSVIFFGNKDRHCTLPSQEPSQNFTRLSSSVQLNERYMDKVINPGPPLNKHGQQKDIGDLASRLSTYYDSL